MTILVGYPPDGRGRAGIALAAMLARSAGDDVVVCTVVPAPWLPGVARIDAEYQSFLDDQAARALDQARAELPADVAARFVAHHARSVPSGLLEQAEQHGATVIVLGSSSTGALGHVVLSSSTDRLLYSAAVPLALAPRGFRPRAGGKLARVTVAYGGSEHADELVAAAGTVAARTGAMLRLASFAVQPPPPTTTRFSIEADEVVAEWAAGMRAAAQQAMQKVDGLSPSPLELVIGYGQDWDEALEDIDWREGDILVIGSSTAAPVAQVFLGSRGAKIVRHSPVPVVVVPRAAAEELAAQ